MTVLPWRRNPKATRPKPDRDQSLPVTAHSAAGDDAVDFLQMLRPGGPWVLSAIDPNTEAIETITAKTPNDVEAFVRKHEGKCNMYYSVNPTRTAMTKKAEKTDIARIEFILADLDPMNAETPAAAKARYLKQLDDAPKPTAAIDSGNGVQCLWRLEDPIDLAEPVWVDEVITKNGKKQKKRVAKFSDADQANVEDVEARNAAIMLRLGAKAGTQNIDRILRLPGTTNLPNKAKAEKGRVACPAKLLWFSDAAHPLSAFPKAAASKKAARKAEGGEDKLARHIREKGVPKGERSERVWFVVNEMLRRGYRAAAIMQVLLDRANGISEHVHDQSKPQEYGARQVKEAIEKIDFIRNKNDEILRKNAANIRIALLKLDVTVRYDQFADRTLIDGLPGFGPALDDAAVNRLWLLLMERLRFSADYTMLRIVLNDTARLNGFHPVRDYLNGLRWDGKPRLDNWLTVYAGAEKTEYTRAVGALVLIAAVRRVRQPGCKFDEMLVLEQPAQGTDKSSALGVLAGNEEWFTDDLPLNVEGKRVIETLRGRWIVEASELSGKVSAGGKDKEGGLVGAALRNCREMPLSPPIPLSLCKKCPSFRHFRAIGPLYPLPLGPSIPRMRLGPCAARVEMPSRLARTGGTAPFWAAPQGWGCTLPGLRGSFPAGFATPEIRCFQRKKPRQQKPHSAVAPPPRRAPPETKSWKPQF
jgi:hypothetical protein